MLPRLLIVVFIVAGPIGAQGAQRRGTHECPDGTVPIESTVKTKSGETTRVIRWCWHTDRAVVDGPEEWLNETEDTVQRGVWKLGVMDGSWIRYTATGSAQVSPCATGSKSRADTRSV